MFLNLEVGDPEINLEYNDLTLNLLEAEWGQTTESSPSESMGKTATRRWQSPNSAGERVMRKFKSQLFLESSEMEISGSEQ